MIGVLSAGGAHFPRDCDARTSTGKQSSDKGKMSKSWSKSEGKGKSKENKGKSKGKSMGTKGAKGLHKSETSKTGLSGLETSKLGTSSEESAQTLPTDNSWIHDGWSLTNGMMAGVLMNGMMTGVLLDGTKVENKRTTTQQAHFHLEVFDLGAMSSPKRFEWVKMNLDTGAAVNQFSPNFGPDGAGDGRFYRTACCEWIPHGGAWQNSKDTTRKGCFDL